VDDGSTDDTAQRLHKYKDKINYIFKKNGGQASAMNTGFENSRGGFINPTCFIPGECSYLCVICRYFINHRLP